MFDMFPLRRNEKLISIYHSHNVVLNQSFCLLSTKKLIRDIDCS